jgi:SAM-dependent methyltransferase
LAKITDDSLATIEFILHWQSDNACHTDSFLAKRVNIWRDIFPERLLDKLKGAEAGDIIRINFEPGTLVPLYSKSLVGEIPFRKFTPRTFGGIEIKPSRGRFLPQGMLSGVIGVYPQTVTPMRILEVGEDSFLADFNHPFSKFSAVLECRIQNVAPKETETGGRLHHWAEEIFNYGPGMQAGLKDLKTDFLCKDFYARSDEKADNLFYNNPRLVGHVDSQASLNLTKIYSEYLSAGMDVLDLMSSVESHLPDDMNLNVTGLGLNMDELRSNPVLADRIVHDLNADSDFPVGDKLFDAVICSLSIEYLTDPVGVLKKAHEVLRPGGVLLIGVSNRWFPTKVTNGWLALHEYERMGYIRQLMELAGFEGEWGTDVIRNDWRPVTDKHYYATRGASDPIYVVRGRK